MDNQAYFISSQQDKMDIDLIYQNLSSSYWAKNISQALVAKSIENSLCFGVFDDQNSQVGFARVITDKATFAYLSDVFIVPTHQGKGLSQLLLKHVMAHPDLQGLRRIMLATKDAHGLYKKFNFNLLKQPDFFMETDFAGY